MAQMVTTAGSLMRSVLLPFILLAFIIGNWFTVNDAFGSLLRMASRVHSVEATGIKVAFKDPEQLNRALGLSTELKGPEREALIASVRRLSAPHIERLFTVDPAHIHCVYTKPDANMRRFLMADSDLETWDLVTMKLDEKALEEFSKQVAEKPVAIGVPRSCYHMELTTSGINAKTALLGVIRDAFEGFGGSRQGGL
jgi:hypothetical protein